jgi:hypothetical protein
MTLSEGNCGRHQPAVEEVGIREGDDSKNPKRNRGPQRVRQANSGLSGEEGRGGRCGGFTESKTSIRYLGNVAVELTLS